MPLLKLIWILPVPLNIYTVVTWEYSLWTPVQCRSNLCWCLLNPQYPSPGPNGYFINTARDGSLTSPYPDTSSSIAELKNLPFDQLRKGFPRNPILNINQSLDRLPSWLASRVAATAQFTTIRSVDLIGEDFEMETCAGATGAHDAETDPTTLALDGVTVASILGVENQELSLADLRHVVDSAQIPDPQVSGEQEIHGDVYRSSQIIFSCNIYVR